MSGKKRNLSVSVAISVGGVVYSRVRFRPEAITNGYLETIRKTTIKATEFALRVNKGEFVRDHPRRARQVCTRGYVADTEDKLDDHIAYMTCMVGEASSRHRA